MENSNSNYGFSKLLILIN